MGFVEEDDMDEEEETEDVDDSEEGSVEEEETVDEVEEEVDTSSEQSDVDLDSLVPGATDVSSAADEENLDRIQVWSDEGKGKTHFCYTMPDPIMLIDTENKAGDIAHKFSDKTVKIWTVSDFDEAVKARDTAMNALSEYKAQTGETGTIVVDSMANMWEFAQHKYIEEWYPNTPPEDVELQLQDWPKIKEIHNKQFRRGLCDSDFHLGWTATRKDDIGATIQDDLDHTPDKPGGETDNVYKVNSIIKLRPGQDGVPVGDLEKSGRTRFKYIGLRRPTYPKHQEIIEEIEEIEVNGASTAEEVQSEFDLDYDVTFTEAETAYYLRN